MPEERILQIIKKNLLFKIDRDIKPDDGIDELNINPLVLMGIVVDLEIELRIDIKPETFGNLDLKGKKLIRQAHQEKILTHHYC